ncbi:unnamed protein product, partial [Discosporangium mesarthrocarpum]
TEEVLEGEIPPPLPYLSRYLGLGLDFGQFSLKRTLLRLAMAQQITIDHGMVNINAPTDECAKQCSRILKEKGAIKNLILNNGTITHNGVSSISRALKGNTTLRLLSLSGNDVGDIGSASLGKILSAGLPGTSLTSLNLSSCNLTICGLSVMVKG